MIKGIFSTNEVLLAINARLGEVFNATYRDDELVLSEGYLPIHVSHEAQIMQVLQEFAGQYVIKRAQFGEIDSEGNQTITWEDMS